MDRRRGLAPLLFIVFCSLYVLTSGGHFTSSDDVQKLSVLEAVFEHGTFAFGDGWVVGLGNRLYAWFPLGASLVMLPGYFVGKLLGGGTPAIDGTYAVRFCIVMENAIFSAALIAVFAAWSRRLGASVAATIFASLALGLGTMVWPYAKTAWSEPVATLLLFSGLASLFIASEGARRREWWLAGICLAGAVLVRHEMAIAALTAGVWLVWRLRLSLFILWPRLLGLVAPMAAAVALCLWYNQARYGSALSFPSYAIPQGNVELTYGRLGWACRSLLHYTVHPSQGVLWYSPAVLLGLLGARTWTRRHGAVVGFLAVSLLPLLCFYVIGWGPSSWAWSVRYVYPFVPFALLPAVAVWEAAGRLRAWGMAVLGVGATVQAVAVLNNPLHLYQKMLETRPDMSIVDLLGQPLYSPLLQAFADTPRLLRAGLALVLTPTAEPLARVSIGRDVPDLWPMLYLQSGMPRGLLALAFGMLLLVLIYGVMRLAALRRVDA